MSGQAQPATYCKDCRVAGREKLRCPDCGHTSHGVGADYCQDMMTNNEGIEPLGPCGCGSERGWDDGLANDPVLEPGSAGDGLVVAEPGSEEPRGTR